MAHEKLNIDITRKWTLAQAKLEPDSGITSVGGLAHRLGGTRKTKGAAPDADTKADAISAASPHSSTRPVGELVRLLQRPMRLRKTRK
jgi:hypothetical protein